jgi:hypothetical protein
MNMHMPTDINETVAANLRAEIARRKRRQADLVDLWGLSPMGVSRRISGAVPLSPAELSTAADWLGVDMADLLPPATERASA